MAVPDVDLALPRAVFFDWDGTLVDSLGIIVAGHNYVRDHYALPRLSRDQVLEMMKAGASMEIMRAAYGDRADEALQLYRRHVIPVREKGISLLPGARDLIETLYTKKIPMGVVSNSSPQILKQEIAHFGWEAHFAAIVGADEADHNKPHPAPLWLGLERAGLAELDPAGIWYVGDMETDVLCAQAAGCRPIYLTGKAEGEEEDADFPENEIPELTLRGCEALRLKIVDIFSKSKNIRCDASKK